MEAPKGEASPTWTPRRTFSHISSNLRGTRQGGQGHRTPVGNTRLLDIWRHSRGPRSLPIQHKSHSRIAATYSSPRGPGGSRRIQTQKSVGMLKLKKRLFLRDEQASRLILMNPHKAINCLSTFDSVRLPRGTWVGLRCPWFPSACPLCQKTLTTLTEASLHFKRLHTALKVLYLCAVCGTAGSNMCSITNHGSRCGKGKVHPAKIADHLCGICSKSFGTKRGLSQHVRWAHIDTYMRRLSQEGGLGGKSAQH